MLTLASLEQFRKRIAERSTDAGFDATALSRTAEAALLGGYGTLIMMLALLGVLERLPPASVCEVLGIADPRACAVVDELWSLLNGDAVWTAEPAPSSPLPEPTTESATATEDVP